MNRTAVVALASALTACAAPAYANYTYDSYDVIQNQNVHITDSAFGLDNVYAGAGMIGLTNFDNSGNTMFTWCVDIADDLANGGSFSTRTYYDNTNSNGYQTYLNDATTLISNGVNYLGTNDLASSALQVALWEMLYGPSITVTADNPDVNVLANSFIANVNDGAWKLNPDDHLVAFSGNGNQTQAYVEQVPEPMSLALLMVGMIGVALIKSKSV